MQNAFQYKGVQTSKYFKMKNIDIRSTFATLVVLQQILLKLRAKIIQMIDISRKFPPFYENERLIYIRHIETFYNFRLQPEKRENRKRMREI